MAPMTRPAGSASTIVLDPRARLAAIVGAVVMVILPVLMPSSMQTVLVVSALGAGTLAVVVAQRTRSMDRSAWTMIGIGQVLNGLGNFGFLWSSPIAPGWMLTMCFNVGTFLTVLGMFALVVPAGRTRDVVDFALDMLVLLSCAFCVVWTLNLEHSITGDAAPQSVLGGVIVLAIVIDFAGIALAPWLLRLRRGEARLAVGLTVPSLVVATIGDMNLPTRFLGASSEAAALCWVLSSSLLLIAAAHVTSVAHRRTVTAQSRKVDLVMLPVVGTGLMYLFVRDPLDDVGRAALVVMVAAVLGRAALIYTYNLGLRRALIRAANEDRLTKLPNRRAFERRLATQLESERTAVVVFCDVDGFKEINDTGGHPAGDAVLVEVGKRLSEVLGEGNVCRLAGDEFTAVLPTTTTAEELSTLMAVARQRIAEPIEYLGRPLSVTLSAGASVADAETAGDVMMHADLALHTSKRRGRNMFLVYEPEMKERVDLRFRTGQRLGQAIRHDGLRLAFQPIRDLRTGSLRAEALLRWLDDDGGEVVNAQMTVEIAHELGLAAELGVWTIRAAVRQIAEWDRADLPVRLSVNLSAHQMTALDVPKCIREACAEYAVAPSSLVIEVTEAVLVEAPAVVAQLRRLRSLGVRVSLDDFGTGYSNFASLIELPIDELKLDQRFLSGGGEPQRRWKVVGAILALAKELGLTVTVEGVETQAQFDQAVALGVDCVQGYVVARPVPADELAFMLTTVDLPAEVVGRVDN